MLPESIVTALDYTRKPFGLINMGIKEIFSLINFQSLNQFEIIFIQKYTKDASEKPQASSTSSTGVASQLFSSVGNVLERVNTSAILDQAVATFLADSITPEFSGIEYERNSHKNYVKELIHPEEISITFIETEMGTVRTWIDAWQDEIFEVTTDGRVRWKNNQEASKKDCWIIPQTRMGLPTFAIKVCGMKFKNIDPPTFAQNEGEPMKLNVIFSVDMCWFLRFEDVKNAVTGIFT